MTVEEIKSAISGLSQDEASQLQTWLLKRSNNGGSNGDRSQKREQKKRIAGLRPNSVKVAAGFDEPLSDEFWAGHS